MQKRCTAENDGRTLRMHPAQHREHTEEHVIGNDDVGGKNLQGLFRSLVLRWDGVDEDALADDAQPLEPRWYVFQLGNHRENFPQIEVRARGKGKEFESAGFDAGAKGGACQEGDLVAFGRQDACNRKQRIEMTRRRRRSDKNFHVIGPLIVEKRSRLDRTAARLQRKMLGWLLRVGFQPKKNGYGGNVSPTIEQMASAPSPQVC